MWPRMPWCRLSALRLGKFVGAEASVTMVNEDSFVGRQTPLIQAGSGIRQNDLGLVKAKRYVGYVWLKAVDPSATSTISLGTAPEGTVIEGIGTQYAKYPVSFTAEKSSDTACACRSQSMAARVYVGTASLMPADNVDGMRADTLKLLKQLNAPMYRWPGGNFVSGYDWRDGIGDRDRRPPRQNPAWTGVEHNDFGLDEFIAFCRRLERNH